MSYLIYIIIAVAVIALYIVWSRLLDENTKSDIKTLIWRWKFPIIIVALFLYFYRVWGYVGESWLSEIKSAWVFFVFMLMVWGLGKLFIQSERYASTHAVADNKHGSCAKYEFRGDWAVLNIGSIDATAFPYPYGHEVWVCRKESVAFLREQIVCKTQLTRADILEVPPEVSDFISSTTGYNKENIYFGVFTQALKFSDPKYDAIELKLRDTNRMLNENRTMLKGKTSAIKAFVSDASTIQRKASGKQAVAYEQPRGEEHEPY